MIQMTMQMQQDLTLQKKLSLTLENKLGLRLSLLAQLGVPHYRPSSKCPGCHHELSVKEIVKGFSDNVNDHLTTCPRKHCPTRFQSRLTWTNEHGSRQELIFMCRIQALHIFRYMHDQEPQALYDHHPSAYMSLHLLCGSLAAAFATVDVDYKWHSCVLPNWEEEIQGVVGKHHDHELAKALGLPTELITARREQLSITRKPFRSVTPRYIKVPDHPVTFTPNDGVGASLFV